MVKKNRNRQTQESPTVQNGGDSAESGDQKKMCSSGCKCSHIQKAINLAAIKRTLKNGCLASDCPGCIKDGVKPEGDETVQSSGLWLCLQCGHQGCGRTEKQHALKHFSTVHSDPHCVAVNTTTWNVWCYSCEVELPSEYRKKLQECVKYLKNLDCPSSVRGTARAGSMEGSKDSDSVENSPMPLSDVTNMPHGVRAPKKKMISLPRVRGLQNLGNTCFFNSVLQCLAQTPHFLELLQDSRQGGTRFCLPGGKDLLPKVEGDEEEEEEEELPPLEGTLTKWGALTETLANTLEELRQDDATAINPQRLLNKLTAKCPQFGGGDQHDAHELLRHLLDEVRTEDLKRYWIAILDQYGLSRHDTNETVDGSVRTRVRAYGRQAGERLLLPDPVFQGILVSTVECQDCLHSYQRTEAFYELSLAVSTNKPQPPVMRRKAGGEDSFDMCGNVTSETPSKHQLKKERRQQRKGRKKQTQQQQQKSARVIDLSSGEPTITEAHNTAESEQSDADVEDNVEQDVSLKETRTGEMMVNGDVIPSLDLKLCNGNISDDEIDEYQRTSRKKKNKNRGLFNGDLACPVKEKLCYENGNEKDAVNENGEVARSSCSQSKITEEATNNRRKSLTGDRDIADKRMESVQETGNEEVQVNKGEMETYLNNKGDEEIQNSSVREENTSDRNFDTPENTFAKENKPIENGIEENPEQIGNIVTGIDENKFITKDDVSKRTSIGSETIEIMNSSNDSSLTPPKDLSGVVPSEFSLSISTIVNSPSALGSPVSNTGSPSSISSDLNVDLSASNHVPANNWIAEDTDRPFSRIAFCNDDDDDDNNNNSNNNNNNNNDNDNKQPVALAAEDSLSCAQKTPGEESSCKEVTCGNQLVKEMANLTLGLDERQSPSHWDTCSAHSLEDLKESKIALPLEVPMCNGGSKLEPEPLDEPDKSGTLAPRYHCGDKECSIESCLNQFTLLELMTGSCKVICESCTERINKGKKGKMVATNSTKQYLVSNPPAVLVLHLKRFEVHQNMFRKTPRHVTFPMMLDIGPICNSKCRELPTMRKGQTKVVYSLYGVVQHSGTLHGGHYSAYVKVRAPVKRDDMRWCFLPTTPSSERLEELSKGASAPPSETVPGKWYHVSDSRVNEVNEDRVLHSQAYLLFYERVW